MKKRIHAIMFITLSFLCFPGFVVADYLWTTDMTMTPSYPVQGGYYADYDGLIDYGFLGEDDPVEAEIFCTEGNADGYVGETSYDFFTIDNSLITYGISASLLSAYKEATWYANWYTQNPTENNKAIAQTAIWETIGFHTYGTYSVQASALMSRFDAVYDQNANAAYAYASNWLLAVSPSDLPLGEGEEWSIEIGEDYQNYLVPNPVPEPTTALLFGFGILGLGLVTRKKIRG